MFELSPSGMPMEQAPPAPRSRKTLAVMGAVLLAVGSGVGFAVLMASRQRLIHMTCGPMQLQNTISQKPIW